MTRINILDKPLDKNSVNDTFENAVETDNIITESDESQENLHCFQHQKAFTGKTTKSKRIILESVGKFIKTLPLQRNGNF